MRVLFFGLSLADFSYQKDQEFAGVSDLAAGLFLLGF
jgi:hypothetical protein